MISLLAWYKFWLPGLPVWPEALPGQCVGGVARASFGVYRLGVWWMDWKAPCGCLRHLIDAPHIPAERADSIMKGALVYLLLGSYGTIGARVRGKEAKKE